MAVRFEDGAMYTLLVFVATIIALFTLGLYALIIPMLFLVAALVRFVRMRWGSVAWIYQQLVSHASGGGDNLYTLIAEHPRREELEQYAAGQR